MILDTYEPPFSEIKGLAHRLYLDSGCMPGRDLENWMDARDLLIERHREDMLRMACAIHFPAGPAATRVDSN